MEKPSMYSLPLFFHSIEAYPHKKRYSLFKPEFNFLVAALSKNCLVENKFVL